MSDIKLFRLDGPTVKELPGQSLALEKSLQNLNRNRIFLNTQ